MRPVENGGFRERKDPALSERQLALRAASGPSSLALCWSQWRTCVCVCAQSMSGGGNTVLLMLTLAGSFCSTHSGLILQHRIPGNIWHNFVNNQQGTKWFTGNQYIVDQNKLLEIFRMPVSMRNSKSSFLFLVALNNDKNKHTASSGGWKLIFKHFLKISYEYFHIYTK